jgi:hypothetical protein
MKYLYKLDELFESEKFESEKFESIKISKLMKDMGMKIIDFMGDNMYFELSTYDIDVKKYLEEIFLNKIVTFFDEYHHKYEKELITGVSIGSVETNKTNKLYSLDENGNLLYDGDTTDQITVCVQLGYVKHNIVIDPNSVVKIYDYDALNKPEHKKPKINKNWLLIKKINKYNL